MGNFENKRTRTGIRAVSLGQSRQRLSFEICDQSGYLEQPA